MNLPYQKHSQTSQDAAMKNTTSHVIRNEVLLWILSSNEKGMIADEVAEKLEMIPNMIASRIKELEDFGHIIKTKYKRKTRRDRQAFIYVAKKFWNDDMGKAPVKRMSANEEKRVFLEALKEHIDELGLVHIRKDDPIYNRIKELLAR